MNDQIITPWDVIADKDKEIDYSKVINQFGCQPMEDALVARMERLTGKRPHVFLRRGMVFAHRDFDKILDAVERKEKFYLYTGRGPSSGSMHIGHAIPFLLCKYLQDAFDADLVIQITDDEKFLWKNLSLKDTILYGKQNIKDIIAFGFNPLKTHIFSNIESAHHFVENTLKIGKSISLNDAMKVFGFTMSHNVSQIEFPVKEIAPCFSSSFSFLPRGLTCLIPAAIDQDPYFRLARDKAHILKEKKPCTIYSTFLSDLKGMNGKMSASDVNSSIYLTDTPAMIKKKINKYAFSGGRDTIEEHRKYGGNTNVDVAYNYLRYFLEDDNEFERLGEGYRKGEITSGEMKARCIEVIQHFILDYQQKRAKITDEIVDNFMAKW
ncbi:Tryptophan--tRNA ligase [Astathelohania contejeani]|uniref:tryptophan--tRNA ligase n=1 Tax=Astathelohania contejeani TaxID=164912 RepID=A0ABQ7HW82_9MICR|nr:Tryptophan--tRNA ligase [Thelohania contejeani]